MPPTLTPEAPADGGVLQWAPAVYLAATGIGVIMRLMVVGVPSVLPFQHLLHAHSHALYFGWAALVVLGAGATTPATRRWAWAGLGLVVPMTVAFLLQGYGPFSIAASAAVMLAWYGAMLRWWREKGRDPLFAASFAYVVMASAGIWVLAPLQAAGNGDGLASRLSIHAFLSSFAWSLVLGTIALVIREGVVQRAVAHRVAAWFGAVAWLLFPLGVTGGPEVPGLGWVARLAAFAVLVPAGWWIWALWRGEADRTLRLAGGWLALAVAGLAVVAGGGSTVLTAVGRPGPIIYLHALLLGYTTTVLAWYMSRRRRVDVAPALTVHHVGVAIMLTGVAFPLVGADPLLGDWAAAAGAAVTWAAGWGWALPLWRTA